MVGLTNNKGGVETYIKNLCEHLSSEEFEVIYSWPQMFIEGKEWVRPKNRHNYIKYVMFWHKFFKENRFDAIYYNACDIVSIDLLKFAKRAGVPVRIIHAHSTANQFKLKPFHYITQMYNRKNISNIATELFACSDEAGNWMFERKKFTVIRNGIDLEKYLYNTQFRKDYRELLNVGDNYLIGCVGRLSPEKNSLMSLQIMSRINDLCEKTKFIFIGEGELGVQIKQIIGEQNLKDKVIMLGARNDVDKWYSAMDCLLMPSLFEGLPFTLVEAQATGLPCVVSSMVSEKANLTGLVQYIGLEEELDVWASKILEECKMVRKDATQQLVSSGYSIIDTANQVSGIIKKELE